MRHHVPCILRKELGKGKDGPTEIETVADVGSECKASLTEMEIYM